ncbi:TPA: helix-turn-helix domain-containing protein [Legionella pneumophila subsp. pneumophila]|uniref:helix-turn-helix domain-containing protein n=1 Tax=Legionella TaxID=445 RepID=UPI00077072E9|nr:MULTISPECIES: helix-turn-helix transcriptional regulator [Legionella]HAT9058443.1 helix-turn-helix domain-containing protein [Legionella pneumophila subsp. pneumophila]MCW8399393.1 helix-turn-helix domain-containing protein [Legionella sp. PATHC038]CZG72759.1 antitoxin HipB [Legionella pneumophila]CZG76738.1 antitoxin HipB [Legionella pneumophila]CZG95067.1 antitoxin HipB [Legionella pneumophila]
MKTLTLNEFIDDKINNDEEFAKHYEREQIINNIAVMIVNARKKRHMTQSELANKIGTKQSVISRLESGNSSFIPSLETLVKVADALNMHLKLQLQA